MIPQLAKEFNQLQHQLDVLLQQVKPFTHQQQNFKPGGTSWSMLQICRHLIQSETQINKYLRKKILGAGKVEQAGVRAFFRSLVLTIAMRLPLKYKVPDAIAVDLAEDYSYEVLSADWKALRTEIRDFLEDIDEAIAKKELFRHPLLGKMSLVQGLRFMNEHVARHSRQLERILQHPDFSKLAS